MKLLFLYLVFVSCVLETLCSTFMEFLKELPDKITDACVYSWQTITGKKHQQNYKLYKDVRRNFGNDSAVFTATSITESNRTKIKIPFFTRPKSRYDHMMRTIQSPKTPSEEVIILVGGGKNMQKNLRKTLERKTWPWDLSSGTEKQKTQKKINTKVLTVPVREPFEHNNRFIISHLRNTPPRVNVQTREKNVVGKFKKISTKKHFAPVSDSKALRYKIDIEKMNGNFNFEHQYKYQNRMRLFPITK